MNWLNYSLCHVNTAVKLFLFATINCIVLGKIKSLSSCEANHFGFESWQERQSLIFSPGHYHWAELTAVSNKWWNRMQNGFSAIVVLFVFDFTARNVRSRKCTWDERGIGPDQIRWSCWWCLLWKNTRYKNALIDYIKYGSSIHQLQKINFK